MTFLTDRYHHLNRIGYALAQAKEGFQFCNKLEDEQKVVRALVLEIGRNLRELSDVCTDEYSDKDSKSYLDGIENLINDEVDNTFTDAIDRRDRDREARTDPTERALSAADRIRETHREAV